MTSNRRPFAIYAITRHGIGIARRLQTVLPEADLLISEKLLVGLEDPPPRAIPLALPLGPGLAERFRRYDCHVFVVSVGAVVRLIAPLLENKKVDPAVICIDDAAKFAICVLSGHVGRGNSFTERVAAALGAQAVITTASDVRGTLTVDILGRELGWRLDDPDRNVTRGCAAVVNAERVLFVQETGEPEWWPLDQPLPPGVELAASLDGVDAAGYEMLLVATDRDFSETHPECWRNAVIYRPRSLVLGLGCDRGTAPDLFERGVKHLLAKHRLALAAVKAMATVEKKADEPALLELSRKYGWPLSVYSAAALNAVAGIENPSAAVERHVGTRGVAEPAALLAAGAEKLLVPKQIYTEAGAGRSMTLAVARIPFPKRPAAAQRAAADN